MKRQHSKEEQPMSLNFNNDRRAIIETAAKNVGLRYKIEDGYYVLNGAKIPISTHFRFTSYTPGDHSHFWNEIKRLDNSWTKRVLAKASAWLQKRRPT